MPLMRAFGITLLWIAVSAVVWDWWKIIDLGYSAFTGLISSFLVAGAAVWLTKTLAPQAGLGIASASSEHYKLAAGLGLLALVAEPVAMLFSAGAGHIQWIPDFSLSFLFEEYVLGSIVLAVSHEYFFRKVIHRELLQHFDSNLALLITALLIGLTTLPVLSTLFGLDTHDFDYTFSLLFAFFGALASGYAYQKSKSVGPALLVVGMWEILQHSVFF